MDKSLSKSSGYDQWMTPPDVIELARKAMGSIDLDPASNHVAQQYVKSANWCIAPDDTESLYMSHVTMPLIDGLNQDWHGNVWLNPPYSNRNIDLFVDRALEQWESNYAKNSHYVMVDPNNTGYAFGIRAPNVTNMIMLVNSATDTKWFHKLCKHASFGLFWSGRIKFWKIFDGKAHEKWEGELSKQRGTGKIGNSPRFLNTLFFFSRAIETENIMYKTFENKGIFFKTL